MAKHDELSLVTGIFSNFSQFVAIIWWTEEFTYNYFSDCLNIIRTYSLIQLIFSTEATEGSLLDDGESVLKISSLLPTVVFCSAQPHAPLWRSICQSVQGACNKTFHVIVNVGFPLNRTARQLESNIRKCVG